MIIEKESKDYFCPIKNDGGEIYCDGSQCAAWRWRDEDYCEDGDYGYCGLAGRPRYSESLY